MSGEDFRPEGEKEQNEQNRNIGAEMLAQMPTWRDHRAAAEQVKEDTKVPEGVRDARDYREYLAEQEARAKEYEKFDNEIFEGIISIEDPNDRDLATAILPYYYNGKLDEDDTFRSARRIGMKAVVDYMNSDKTTSLEDTIEKVADELYHSPNYADGENRRAANAVFNPILDLHSSGPNLPLSNRLGELRNGQKIEQLDLSEAEFDTENERYNFEYKINDRDYYNSFLTPGYRLSQFTGKEYIINPDAKVTLTMANDLVKQMKEIDGLERKLGNITKMSYLQDAYRRDPDRIEETLSSKQEREVNEVVQSTRKVIDSDDYDRTSVLPISRSGLFDLVCLKELRTDFKSYKDTYARYRCSLEIGRSILNGKNWREVNAISGISREMKKLLEQKS